MAVRLADGAGNLITSTVNALDVNIKSGTVAISGSVPVTGTVAISGTVAVTQNAANALNATVHLQDGAGNNITSTAGHLDVNIASGSVSVSNFPATQPVSGTIAITAAALPLPAGACTDASITNGNAKTQTVNGTGVVMDINAKGAQGANFAAVQQPKDTGRNRIVLTVTRAAAITTEALVTLTKKAGTGATTTGTSYTVTAGKTLRITSIQLSILNVATATAPLVVSVRLREGAAAGGAVALASDIIAQIETGIQVATATLNNPGQPAHVMFPDGLEVSAGQNIGVTELATSTNAQVTITIVGFEY